MSLSHLVFDTLPPNGTVGQVLTCGGPGGPGITGLPIAYWSTAATGSVSSVTAGNSTITIGGTASAPTVAVTPSTFVNAGGVTAGDASITIGGTSVAPTVAVTSFYHNAALSLGNGTGPIPATPYTINASRADNLIVLNFPTFTPNGNSTAATLTFSVALPANLWPAPVGSYNTFIEAVSAAASVQGICTISSAGAVVMSLGTTGLSYASSAAATGFNGFSVAFSSA
jgi:hypothetical protein